MQDCSDLTTETAVMVTVPEIRDGQLILPESTAGLTLANYIPVLEQYREINAATVFDYRDKKGNAAARSHVAKLRKIKAPITEIHKKLKADYKAIVDKMDADKRDAIEVVEAMIEFHDKELRVVAAEEKEHEHLEWIAQKHVECWDLAHQMNEVFDQKKDIAKQQAEQDRVAAEQEAERRRLQIEAEKKEAADRAAEEARVVEQAKAARAIEEANERERQAAAEAERKLKEANDRAAREKEEAERKVKEAEEKAAREAQQAEERKRQAEQQAAADQENARRVHWAIIPAMIQRAGVTEDQAKALIIAMRDGSIPAVKIDYQWQLEGGGK